MHLLLQVKSVTPPIFTMKTVFSLTIYIYEMFLIKIESKENIIHQAMKIKLFSKKDAKWFAFFMSCTFCQKSLRISKSQNWLIELTNSWWVFFDVCAHALWNKGRREPVSCHVTIKHCFAFFFIFED